MIVTHVEKGSQITMKDGSYKSIEDILPGDDVQTYVMGGEDFDSANISNNEQKSTRVINCGKSTEEMPLVKINFESVSFDDDGEEVKRLQGDMSFTLKVTTKELDEIIEEILGSKF